MAGLSARSGPDPTGPSADPEVLDRSRCRPGPPVQVVGRERVKTTSCAWSTSTTSSPRDHSAARATSSWGTRGAVGPWCGMSRCRVLRHA